MASGTRFIIGPRVIDAQTFEVRTTLVLIGNEAGWNYLQVFDRATGKRLAMIE